MGARAMGPGLGMRGSEEALASAYSSTQKAPDNRAWKSLWGTQRGTPGNLAGNFVWGLEELIGRAERLQWFNHNTGDPGYTDEYLARVRAVTPKGVQGAAKTWLSKPRAEIITLPGGGK